MARFKLSIRISIVSLIAILIFITGGFIVTTYYIGSKQSVYLLADNMIQEISKYVGNKTRTYLEPAVRSNHLISFAIKEGLIDQDSTPRSLQFLKKILSANPEFVMVYYGNQKGNLFMAKKMPDNSLSERIITRTLKNVLLKYSHSNSDYDASYPSEYLSLEKGYDPRTRLWYTDAQKNKTPIWTDVYTFASDKKPGISYAIPIYDNFGKLQGVSSIDVGVMELSFFLSTLEIGKSGKAFLMDDKNQVIALPIHQETDISKLFKAYQENNTGPQKYRLLAMDELDAGDIKESFKHFQTIKSTANPSQTFTFQYAGATHLARYTPFPKDSGLNWVIGIILPENDIMATVKANNRRILSISSILVIITLLLGVLFSHNISRPLTLLSSDMQSIRSFNLDFEGQVKDSFIKEVSEMSESFENMKTGLKSFQKYVPSDLVAELIQLKQEAVIGGEKKELTIFFSDIADFTQISEQLAPEVLVEHLKVYFDQMSQTILANHGTLDKYIGDAVMAFWGAPRTLPDHAKLAAQAALACQRFLTELSRHALQEGKPVFHTRIGINTGEVIVGNMGSEKRMNYTVLGDAVNLASRLEGLNKYFGTQILLSETTNSAIKEDFILRSLGKVAVKGKTQGVAIYELISEKETISAMTLDFITLFNEGTQAFLAGDLKEALRIFRETTKRQPSDLPSKIFLNRAEHYLQNPVKGPWNGIFILKSK